MYPRLTVNGEKLTHNVRQLTDKCHRHGLTAMGVTKVFCADLDMSRCYIEGGVDFLADSRVENLAKLAELSAPKVLLRLPMLSEAAQVVKYADISLNSELQTIAALNLEAKSQGLRHKILLMIDLGDLREGIWPSDFDETINGILKLEHIELYGLGVNLTCYGGVVPKHENLSQLIDLAVQLRVRFGVDVKMVSGGNSSSLYLLDQVAPNDLPVGINNLRLGEALVLGRETAYGEPIQGTHQDVFTLEAQIIELKEKPSVPVGEIGMDAFGNKPTFVDKGIRRRGILGVGRQDVNVSNLIARDTRLEIIGASSDHLIVDFTEAMEYGVGDIVSFDVEYGALLSLCTSPYVKKVMV